MYKSFIFNIIYSSYYFSVLFWLPTEYTRLTKIEIYTCNNEIKVLFAYKYLEIINEMVNIYIYIFQMNDQNESTLNDGDTGQIYFHFLCIF